MGLVLDSGIFIMAERKGWSLRRLLEEIEQTFGTIPLCTSVVSIAEVAHGTYRSTPQHRHRQTLFLKEIIHQVRVQVFTIEIALQVAEVGANLALTGQRLDFPDLVIGTTALTLDYAVLTNNPRHFSPIPSLTVHTL